ncbi:DASH family cryptochrome [Cocleimonas sp. KMM 6892]|uniref:DASH family cryptochrome n=1 Tax=unclassified Cocleimonas TaxID=2639732 RepID=UPI002DBE3DB0|nr:MULTISPECIES: DASH family cryptochrome [unclassified Cocleimonas]MEB8432620.1 DASH family cryptochrome [Cocleimonas sp. KMM 6892]MEC4715479.1 DASH family cryptochrome [Cocleimonas sp. KMM 6895]MEC4744903.1 DASH family cryptochrome [Cocleimonas sp. KMM 6896]
MKNNVKGLFWFRNDLRLEDNPALNSLVDVCDQLVFVYIFDPNLLEKNHFDQSRLGSPRWQFIYESLLDLNNQLESHQQTLIIKVGKPTEVLSTLINQHDITEFGVTPLTGFYEKRDIQSLDEAFKGRLNWHRDESFTLFNQAELPFILDEMPDGFTPFRKHIEKAIKVEKIIDKTVSKPNIFPAAINAIASDSLPTIDDFIHPIPSMKHHGGEQAARQQLAYYCHQTQHLSHYKETRNGLDGWDFSSKLSAYLAQGCLSPRQVMQTVVEYENQFGANQSTYWLYFELLWREFYQWHQVKYGADLYLERGIQDIDPQLKFDQKAFDQWKDGSTDNDFVNAFMLQLKHTGWMSNRGRQIVASYFINQLGLDWRYGAAWFEQQLIDYDPANNWGNWQYLAGVGVDPRGRRAFNIDKQRKTYDPDRDFINHYLNEF